MANVRWKIADRYPDLGFSRDGAVAYSSSGSRGYVATNVFSFGVNHGLVARHALTGDGTFTHKFVVPTGMTDTFYSFGLDASSDAPTGFTTTDYRVQNGGLREGATYRADCDVSAGVTFVWTRSGTDMTFHRNGSLLYTFTGVTGTLYPHVWIQGDGVISVEGGIYDATITGTTNDTGTPTSAPTISATAGHKRNHIAITYPSGSNGVSIYRATSSNGQVADEPIVTEWRYPYFEDTGLTNGTTYYYKAKATQDGLAESTFSTQSSATPTADLLPTMSDSVALIIGAPVMKPWGDASVTEDINFDKYQDLFTMEWGLHNPKVQRHAGASAGTVSATNGSRMVTGSGTSFLSLYKADGYILIPDVNGGAPVLYRVYFVHSDTSLELHTVFAESTGSREHGPHWHIKDAMPAEPAGTVSVTNGSATVTGSSTTFQADYYPGYRLRIVDSGGAYRSYQVLSIASQTSMTLTATYAGATESGRTHLHHWTRVRTDYYEGYIHYYDLTLSLYDAYYRSGSLYHLQLAREGAAGWLEFHNTVIPGQTDTVGEQTAPRVAGCAGLALRGIELETASPGSGAAYWLAITDYLTATDYWLNARLGGVGDDELLYFDGVRDQSYIIQYACFVGKAHPDSGERTARTADALRWMKSYFGTQQSYYADRMPRMAAFEFGSERTYHFHQPFIDAIYGEAATMVHKLTGDTDVRDVFLEYMTTNLTNGYDDRMTVHGYRTNCVYFAMLHSQEPVGNPEIIPNAPVPYEAPYDVEAWGGANVDLGTAEPITPAYDGTLGDNRFQNCITFPQFGYAYYLTGNAAFITRADARLDHTYEGSDAESALATIRYTGKNTNEAFRRSPTYFAYRDVIAAAVTTSSLNSIRRRKSPKGTFYKN
jgi:hypothetical protein